MKFGIPGLKDFFFTIASLILCTISFAQKNDYKIEEITIDDGLSQGFIKCLLQDKEGFLWVGTTDGLNRYDGYNFKVFTQDNYDTTTISNNTISLLFEDSKGLIWVGTQNSGVNIYQKKSGNFLHIKQRPHDAASLSGSKVTGMQEMPDNRVVISTEDGKYLNIIELVSSPNSHIPTPKITKLALPDDLKIIRMTVDHHNTVWVVGANSLYWLDYNCKSLHKYAEFPENFFLLVQPIEYYYKYNYEKYYCSHRNIYEVVNSLIKVQTSKPSDSSKKLNYYLLKSEYGIIKIYSNLMDNQRPDDLLKAAKGSEIIPISDASKFFIDKSGNLWIGTLGYGLKKITSINNRFETYAKEHSMHFLYYNKAGEIFFYDKNNYLNYISNGEIKKGKMSDLSKFHQIVTSKSGDLWCFTNDIFVQKTPENKKYYYPIKKNFQFSTPVLEDHKGMIWIGSSEGSLYRIDPKSRQLKEYNFSPENLPLSATHSVTKLYQDVDKILWISTNTGLLKADITPNKPEFTWFKNDPNNKNSLSTNWVTSVSDDPLSPSEYLWICTRGGGLNRLNKKTGQFLHFNTSNSGIPNNVVYGVLSDSLGNIWGSTNFGLFCLQNQLSETKNEWIFKNFTKSDGLQGNEFNTDSYLKLPNGNLAFGGVDGFIVFDPETIRPSQYKPNIFFTKLLINNKLILPKGRDGILSQTIETTSKIVLPCDQDNVTLEFASLDFTAPRQNKYRYQMEGLDDEWVDLGKRNTASYAKLPSGTYIFKVRGTNSSGVWSDKEAILQITVLPPWYASWWAYTLYFTSLGLGIWTYIRLRVKGLKENQHYLETIVKDRTSQLEKEKREVEAQKLKAEESEKFKQQFLANMSHEIRTPMNAVFGMTNLLIENHKTPQNIKYLNIIKKSSDLLLHLINDILDLSKIEIGKIELEEIDFSIRDVIDHTAHILAHLVQEKNLQLETYVDPRIPEYLNGDPTRLGQVILNLTSNAVKFTDEGIVKISISKVNDDDVIPILLFKVEDTGVGIPPEKLSTVFDTFSQAHSSDTRKFGGTGLGLSISKQLVALMGGTINVDSKVGKGSTFSFEVSFKNATYDHKADQSDYTVFKGSALDGLCILIVDDNEFNRTVAHDTLTSMANVTVSEAETGPMALELIAAQNFDVILMDIEMPEMDGYEVAQAIRNTLGSPKNRIPIIALTAGVMETDLKKCLDAGMNGYISKPFKASDLVFEMTKVLKIKA